MNTFVIFILLCLITLLFVLYIRLTEREFENIHKILSGIYNYLKEKDINQSIKIDDYVDIYEN